MYTKTLIALAISVFAVSANAIEKSIEREEPVMAGEVAKDRLGSMTDQMTKKGQQYLAVTKSANPGAFETSKAASDLALFRVGTAANSTLVMAGRSTELHAQEHTFWKRMTSFFGDDTNLKDSEQPYSNTSRARACGLEIIAASNQLQQALKNSDPKSETSKAYAEIAVMLAEGAQRAKANPNEFPYPANEVTIQRLRHATTQTFAIWQNPEMQRIAEDAYLLKLYGIDSFRDVAPSFALTYREDTRDLTREVAGACSPPILTQNARKATLPRYFARRDAIAAQLKPAK